MNSWASDSTRGSLKNKAYIYIFSVFISIYLYFNVNIYLYIYIYLFIYFLFYIHTYTYIYICISFYVCTREPSENTLFFGQRPEIRIFTSSGNISKHEPKSLSAGCTPAFSVRISKMMIPVVLHEAVSEVSRKGKL